MEEAAVICFPQMTFNGISVCLNPVFHERLSPQSSDVRGRQGLQSENTGVRLSP